MLAEPTPRKCYYWTIITFNVSDPEERSTPAIVNHTQCPQCAGGSHVSESSRFMALPSVCLVTVTALSQLSSSIRASVRVSVPGQKWSHFSTCWYCSTDTAVSDPCITLTFLNCLVYAHVLHAPLCFGSKDRRLIHCSSTSTRCTAPDGMNVCGCFLSEWNQWTLGLNRLLAPEFLNRWACNGETWDFFWTILDILVLHTYWFVTGQKHC